MVRRDGQPVPLLDGMDFGGLTRFASLPAGEQYTVSADLTKWADVSIPGRYEVDCAFETDFAPAGIAPFEQPHFGERWTRAFHGTVRFVVR